jgi:hypothetical protein
MRRYKLGEMGRDGRRPVTDVVTGRLIGRISCDSGPALLGLLTAERVRELAGPWDFVFLPEPEDAPRSGGPRRS